jgi:hypothetical protein
MRLLTILIGWTLVPFFMAGRFAGRLLPARRSQGPDDDSTTSQTYWQEFTDSYDAASKVVVNSWLKSEGHTIDEIINSGLSKETARELALNLMAGVRDGFIDPGFAHCLIYALSCAMIDQRGGRRCASARLTASWPCEYCVFFKGLRDVILPQPDSPDPSMRSGDKLGECERHGPVTMRGMPPGSCDEFTIERRRHLKLLKQTNEELQLWYLVNRRKSCPYELTRMREFRQNLKDEIKKEMQKKRKRRATDFTFSQR